MKLNRKELLNLPTRNWSVTSTYDSICIVNTGKKHDSGFAVMAIVGIINFEPVEIAAYCDDLQWLEIPSYPLSLRNDMYYPSGIIHFWCHGAEFQVGGSLNTTEIKCLKKNKGRLSPGYY